MQLARDAQAALTGNFINSVEAGRKLLETLEKINEKQDQQREKFEAQLVVEEQKTAELKAQLDLAEKRSNIGNEQRLLDIAKNH